MAKSTGLAVFALIIAFGALGLGAYQVFFVSTPTGEESGIRNTWSDFHEGSVVTNPVSTEIPVNQILINFTVNPGESAFFLFSTSATLQTNSLILFYFALDGVILTGPLHPSWWVSNPGGSMQTPVSFHYMLCPQSFL